MTLAKVTAVFALAAFPGIAAQAPLPELRIEPTGGGSIFYIRNNSAQPLTAYMIELVDYPGSSYTNVEDSFRDPIPAGGEKKVQVTNMTVGAAPEYVKMRAAIYADGSSSGVPEKVDVLLARRRASLATARELIGRLEKAKAAGSSKASAIAELKQWFASLQTARRPAPGAREAMVQSASSGLVNHTIKTLDAGSIEDALIETRATERDLAASKPAL